MKPYKIIHGTSDNIETFEDAVSAALEEGYEFANRLITKVVASSNGASKALFFQPMVFEEMLDEIYEEEIEENEL
jgi:hypothetical protein